MAEVLTALLLFCSAKYAEQPKQKQTCSMVVSNCVLKDKSPSVEKCLHLRKQVRK